jgi:hypothetical protein
MATRLPTRRHATRARPRHHHQPSQPADRRSRPPRRADRAAAPPARPLRPRRPHQSPIRHGRQTLQDELERLTPPADPQLAGAEKLLANFAEFWEAETSPAERHRLLTNLFERVWQDNGQVVAVKPRPAFTTYFQAVAQANESRPGNCGAMSGSDGGRTRSGHRIEVRV